LLVREKELQRTKLPAGEYITGNALLAAGIARTASAAQLARSSSSAMLRSPERVVESARN
jgi:hypothetical protein